MTQPHNVTVTHVPLNGPGFRVAGSIAGEDMSMGNLREILESTEASLELTKSYLSGSEHDLAVAVRGALTSIQALTFHVIELHRGIHRGTINYPEEVREAYPS